MANQRIADGRMPELVATISAIPSGAWNYAAATGGILNTTTAVTVAPATATVRNVLMSVQIMSEALGLATELAIRDGAGGAVLWRQKIGAGGLLSGLNVDFSAAPLSGTAGNLLEVVTLSATVTGAVYFNAQGFQAV